MIGCIRQEVMDYTRVSLESFCSLHICRTSEIALPSSDSHHHALQGYRYIADQATTVERCCTRFADGGNARAMKAMSVAVVRAA